MSFFGKIKSVFSPSKLNRVKGVVGSVYPIVEFVAKMTPTRADDEILQCANMLGVREFLTSSPEKTGETLKELAIKAAQKKFTDVPVEVLARAVESAYQQMKAKDSI